jgi:hypothetical protein
LRLLQRLNDAWAVDAAFEHSVLVLYWDGSKRPGCWAWLGPLKSAAGPLGLFLSDLLEFIGW